MKIFDFTGFTNEELDALIDAIIEEQRARIEASLKRIDETIEKIEEHNAQIDEDIKKNEEIEAAPEERKVTFEKMVRFRGGYGLIDVNINGIYAGTIVKWSTGEGYEWRPCVAAFELDLGIEVIKNESFFVLSHETKLRTLSRAKHYVKTGIFTSV